MKKGEKMPERQKKKISESLMGHSVSEKTREQCGSIWRGKCPPTAFKRGHLKPRNAHKFLRGSKNPNWKNGMKMVKGYWYTTDKGHPFATKQGYVKRSRAVMEKEIGRFLELEEVVHHKNGIKDDDRIDNLMLFDNQSDHIKFHCEDYAQRD